MRIQAYLDDPLECPADVLVVGVPQGAKTLRGLAAGVNRRLNGALSEILAKEKFTGEAEATVLLHTLGRLRARRVCAVGLGKPGEAGPDRHRRVYARAVQAARSVRARSLAVPLFRRNGKEVPPRETAQSAAEGLLLGSYDFARYRKDPGAEAPGRALLLLESGTSAAEVRAGIRDAVVAAGAVNFARDLVNEPGNVINPRTLAARARALARGTGMSCRILTEKEIARMGMGAYLGVAQGSANPPRFIHVTYRPRRRGARGSVALVGKGMTFDSGGLSLKPSEAMRTMKMDKSGACTVLAVMRALPEVRPAVTVHGIVAAAENMPGGRAQRPDDIVRAMNGKTIEVLNTDAEGRLTLADALSYAARLKPDRIIDLATLTGACVVALGEYTAGVMGNDQALLDRFLECAREAGEQMWPLPLDENMKDKLKSRVADLKNIGNRWGGAITAGMFLREFVGETPWVHVDIAGPAFHDKGWGYNPPGATGVGVRAVLRYLASL